MPLVAVRERERERESLKVKKLQEQKGEPLISLIWSCRPESVQSAESVYVTGPLIT